MAWAGPNVQSEDIRAGRRGRESAGLAVAGKRGNACGAKRPYHGQALSEKSGEPLESERLDYGKKLSELRRKLYQKARRGCQRSLAGCSCMPAMKSTGAPDAGKPHVRCDEGGCRGSFGIRPPTLLVNSSFEHGASDCELPTWAF